MKSEIMSHWKCFHNLFPSFCTAYNKRCVVCSKISIIGHLSIAVRYEMVDFQMLRTFIDNFWLLVNNFHLFITVTPGKFHDHYLEGAGTLVSSNKFLKNPRDGACSIENGLLLLNFVRF